MRARFLLALTALALIAAACGTGTSTSPEDGMVLRYAYQPGDEISYNTDFDMSADMTMTGIEDLPGALDMTMNMAMSSRTDYTIEEGPDPETVRLTMTFTVIDGSGTMEMLGTVETIPFDELQDQMASMDMEMVIDAQGDVVEMLVGGEAIPPGLLEMIGGFGGTSGFGSFDPDSLVGPPLPDGPIAVGSTWAEEVDQTTLGIEVHSRTEYLVAAMETVAGRETYRIEGTTTTDAIDVSLMDILDAMAENSDDFAAMFDDEEMTAEDFELALSMFDTFGIEMNMHMDASTMETTTWFDPEAGIIVRMETSGPQYASIQMANIPDAGDMDITMDMTMAVVMQLAE